MQKQYKEIVASFSAYLETGFHSKKLKSLLTVLIKSEHKTACV